MEGHKFVTQTAPKTTIAYCTVAALLLAFIFTGAYYVLPQFSVEIMIAGALLCVSCFAVGLMLGFGPAITLYFENDELLISDSDGKEYQVYAVPAGDFVFIQTPLEKKFDIGCLIIKHTKFCILGVKHISETRKFINDHFPDW